MWIFFCFSQWICTVNNISRQIYLTDNPEVPNTHTCTTASTCIHKPPVKMEFYLLTIFDLLALRLWPSD